MLAKRVAIDSTGGFDPRYFLYFEDFDWSVRLNRVTKTAYVPTVQIGHHGGGAANKGLKHIYYFVKSGLRFYRLHGWKWLLERRKPRGPAWSWSRVPTALPGARHARVRAAGRPFHGLVRTLSSATAARPDMLPVGDLHHDYRRCAGECTARRRHRRASGGPRPRDARDRHGAPRRVPRRQRRGEYEQAGARGGGDGRGALRLRQLGQGQWRSDAAGAAVAKAIHRTRATTTLPASGRPSACWPTSRARRDWPSRSCGCRCCTDRASEATSRG